MPLIVIGGHSRGVGKTGVVAGLIAALPECNWTAVKISQHGHGARAVEDHNWVLSEEQDRLGNSDTSRFLAAGASHAWWVRSEPGCLAEAMPAVRRTLAGSQNVIVESNSILKFLCPDLYLAVVDPAAADFKPSAQELLDRADAVILHENKAQESVWFETLMKPAAGRPLFCISPPNYVTPQIVEFVREKIRKT